MKKYDTGTATLTTQDYIELVKCKEVVKTLLEDCTVFELSGKHNGYSLWGNQTLIETLFPVEFSEAKKKADEKWLKKKEGELTNV